MAQGTALGHAPLGGLARRRRPSVGWRPTVRFVVAFGLTVAYVAFGVYVSAPWRSDLREAIGPVMAWVIPILLAYVPAAVIGFLIFTLLTLRYRVPSPAPPTGPWPDGRWPEVTVIVAAWNEERTIVATLERIAGLAYTGPIEVVLADNNSTDATAELAQETARRLGLDYRRVFEPMVGKHYALNTALESVTTPLVVTVDADTLLHPEALTYLVARVTSRPQEQHVCACAGALVVENAPTNLLSRMQGWDYRLGINGVKRMQAAYNSALVAQGAFSAYWTDDLRAVGGWPDAIGEDIVLTWTLMDSRGIVQYEPCALGFTVAPEKLDAVHAPTLTLGTRHVREPAPQPAHRPTTRTGQVRQRNRLPGAVARHRLHLFLDPRRDPVRVRLSAAVFLVVDARNPDHADHLRAPTPLAGTARLPPPRRTPQARHTRLLRLPVRLPGADLIRLPTRLPPIPHGAARRWS